MPRGRNPTPKAILEARGSKHAKYVRREDLQGPPGRPDRPAWLIRDARRKWDELIPLLDQMGVLSLIDASALARYCDLHRRWCEARKVIDRDGPTYTTYDEGGEIRIIRARPEVAMCNSLGVEMGRLEPQFGMTPAGRARLSVEAKSQKDDAFDKFQASRLMITAE